MSTRVKQKEQRDSVDFLLNLSQRQGITESRLFDKLDPRYRCIYYINIRCKRAMPIMNLNLFSTDSAQSQR